MNSLVAVMVRKKLKILETKTLFKSHGYPTYNDIRKSRNEHIEWELYKAAILGNYLKKYEKGCEFRILGGVMKAPKSNSVSLSSTFPSKL